MNKKLIARIIKERTEGSIDNEIADKLITEGWTVKETTYAFTLSDIITASPDCEKLISKVATAGTAVVTFGSVSILLPILCYIAELFDPNLTSGPHALPKLTVVNILFYVLLGTIYMILGKRMESGIDMNQKKYVYALSLVSLLLLFMGAGSVFFIIAIVNLLMAWLVENKLFKITAFRDRLIAPVYKMKKLHWIFITLAVITMASISMFQGNWSF